MAFGPLEGVLAEKRSQQHERNWVAFMVAGFLLFVFSLAMDWRLPDE
jgi:hypothetical protein